MNNSNDTLLFCRSTQKLCITLKSKKKQSNDSNCVRLSHDLSKYNTLHYNTVYSVIFDYLIAG